MKIFTTLMIVAAVCAAVSASRVAIERTTPLDLKDGWRSVGRKATATELEETRRVIFALWGKYDELLDTFHRVSNPKNADYGKYLTIDEITAMVAPEDEVVEAFTKFLSKHGVAYSVLPNRDMIRIEAVALSKLEKMFGVEYEMFVHKSGKMSAATLGPYSLPKKLAKHTAYVTGVVDLPDVYEPRQLGAASPSDDTSIGPKQVWDAYQLPTPTGPPPPTSLNVTRCVVEFQGQYISDSDLEEYFKTFIPDVAPEKIAKMIGDNQPNNPGVEANLDIQAIMGVYPGIPTWAYVTANFNFWEGLTAWLAHFSANISPQVFSISYGSQQGGQPSDSYRTRADAEYAKFGTRGVSIIFASGDSGAGCTFGKLNPSYPATSPHVVSIGATRFQSGNSGPEAAVEAFLSGGGFSHFFPGSDASFQKDAVDAYLKSGVKFPSKDKFNANNRATPDAAAVGSEHFEIIVNGQKTEVGGTSVAAPVFASVISAVNEQLVKAGKPTLGFLGPFIYQNTDAFTDITVGNNVCAGGDNGYQCAKGYDAVTGVGTPIYPALLKAAMALTE